MVPVKIDKTVALIIASLIALAMFLMFIGGGFQPYFSGDLFPSHDKTLVVNGTLP